MIAQDVQIVDTRYHRLEVANRWLLGVGAVLLAASIGLGAYVAVDRFAVTDNAVQVDEMLTTLAGDDFESWQALYSPEMIGLGPEGGNSIGTYAGLEQSFDTFHQYGTVIERTGEISAFGPFVTYQFEWSNKLGIEGTGMSLLQFDDAGRIVADFTLIVGE